MLKFLLLKFKLALKFIFIFHILNSMGRIISRRSVVDGVRHFLSIIVCITARYLVLVMAIIYIPLAFVYIIVSLLLYGEVSLSSSKKYLNGSRLFVLFLNILWKKPFEGAKFVVYTVLRLFLNKKKEKIRLNLLDVLYNTIFTNLFGSPVWIFERARDLNEYLERVFEINLSSKNRPLRIRINLIILALNDLLDIKCRYYSVKCKESRIFIKNKELFFNMFWNPFKARGSVCSFSRTAITLIGGKERTHPIIAEDSKNDKFDTGYIITHTPLNGQDYISYRLNNESRVSNMVINNYQSEDLIRNRGFRNIEKDEGAIKVVREFGEAMRYTRESKIFTQSCKSESSGNRFFCEKIDKTYSNLDYKTAKIMGISPEGYESIKLKRKRFCYESEYEKEVIDINLKLITSDNELRIGDFSEDSRFLNLKTEDKVNHIAVSIMLRNDHFISEIESEKILNESLEYLSKASLNPNE